MLTLLLIGNQIVEIGQASETDSANSIAPGPARLVSRATETNYARKITPLQVYTYDQIAKAVSLSWRFEPSVTQTRYSSGNIRQRRLFANSRYVFDITLRLTDSEFATFESFVINDLKNGANYFNGTYAVSDLTETGKCRIIDGQYNAQYIKNDWWNVSYSFEVIDIDLSNHLTVYTLVNAVGGYGLWGYPPETDGIPVPEVSDEFSFSPSRVPSDTSIAEITSPCNVRLKKFDPAYATHCLGANRIGPYNKMYLEFKASEYVDGGISPYDIYVGICTQQRFNAFYKNDPLATDLEVINCTNPTKYDGYPAEFSNIGFIFSSLGGLSLRVRSIAYGTSPNLSGTNNLNQDWDSIAMLAIDWVNGKMWVGADGVWRGNALTPGSTDPAAGTGADILFSSFIPSYDPSSDLAASWYPFVYLNTDFTIADSNLEADVTIYGSSGCPFNYSVPSGFNV